MLQIEEPQKTNEIPLLSLGFRVFFLGAAGFAIVAMLIWMYIYRYDQQTMIYHLPASIWHAHEMIYGYSAAVIAGFLLTAVKNWTAKPVPSGWQLLFLFGLWVMARVANYYADLLSIEIVAATELLFFLLLCVHVTIPIISARQWRNASIVLILLALLLGDVVFYAALLGILPQGIQLGLYFGFYIILTLIFIMARRVIPFFIEQGVEQTDTDPLKLNNIVWVDKACIGLFVFFWLLELLSPNHFLVSVLAGLLFLLHGSRLITWYTPGIWRRPLLWSLYLGYACLVVAFLLKSAVLWLGLADSLAVHAFAYGGIGMITVAMMSRVSLGHTGRKVAQPPRLLFSCFLMLFVGVIVRVVFPILDISHYDAWVALSQLCWIVAFSLFIYIYLPILSKPSLD